MAATGPTFAARARAPGRPTGSPLAVSFDYPPRRPWPEPHAANDSDDRAEAWPIGRQQVLASIVELAVVPRLGVGTGTPPACATRGGDAAPQFPVPPGNVATFARLLTGPDSRPAHTFADRFLADGNSAAALYLELFAPAAGYLGTLWDNDWLDFAAVTVGLGRLHQMLRHFGPAFHSGARAPRPDRHALLMAAPGEQHSFGLAVVCEFFRRAAWCVWHGEPREARDAAALARDNWLDIVGFSLGSAAHIEKLKASINGVRRASRNRGVCIMVGGPVFLDHPEFAAQLGADAMVVDADQAVSQAEALLAGVAAPI